MDDNVDTTEETFTDPEDEASAITESPASAPYSSRRHRLSTWPAEQPRPTTREELLPGAKEDQGEAGKRPRVLPGALPGTRWDGVPGLQAPVGPRGREEGFHPQRYQVAGGGRAYLFQHPEPSRDGLDLPDDVPPQGDDPPGQAQPSQITKEVQVPAFSITKDKGGGLQRS